MLVTVFQTKVKQSKEELHNCPDGKSAYLEVKTWADMSQTMVLEHTQACEDISLLRQGLIAMAAMMVVKLHHFGSLSIPIHEIAWSSQLS